MDHLNVIVPLLEAARHLPERIGVDSFYLCLGGLLLVLIGASMLITFLVWLRYLASGALIIVAVMGFNPLRRRLHLLGEGRGTERDG